MPSNVNYRANIFALKELGCTHIVVTNACGSLRENIKPGHIIFPDQFIDRTTKRASTFYDGAELSPKGVCHIPMHTPFCPATRKILAETAKKLEFPHHESGTIVVIEGPRFSTRAESHLFQSWNCDIIGMTTVPEVVLANELGLCYAAVAMATDYDCWRYDESSVCVDEVMATMKQNAYKATQILLNAIPAIAEKDWSNILKENEMEDISFEDVEETIKLIKEVPQLAGNVSDTVQNVLKRMKNNELETHKGISFLDLKNQIMLSYVTNLSYIVMKKLQGEKIEDDPVVERLVELRIVLEKMRPIDEKLKYQINKLLATATSGNIDTKDPLRFRANPESLEDQEEEDTPNESKRESKVYVPPKISAAYFGLYFQVSICYFLLILFLLFQCCL
ncbi:S-methyl-5'-thioadenosine phosphorylase-like isoform X2 [Stegodyphus dumicola]|nr:S-methyl-5'-thioadenosine phosphorylase-like isoform X2 [Stegodyphus dumicola]XP_035216279.1 S-methyl-5'-thioadenosine phosphorylase-like isoform X2 [Stegodyphus dumicola]